MGSNGTILKTINGGETWTAQTSGTSNSIWSVYFLNANRGWAVGNNGEILIAVDNVLPLRFTGFTVKKCGSNACLNWTTVNEENVDRIEIERSSDGRTFEKIFSLPAQNINIASYEAIDRQAQYGVVYYRLKSIDRDGSFSYSQIAKLDFEKNFSVLLSPNPVRNILHIQGAANFREIRIVDMNGKIIKKLDPKISGYDLNSLSRGIYLV